MKGLALLLLVSAVGAAASTARRLWEMQQWERGLQRTVSAGVASPRFFEQYQDHFDGTNANTWQQAYYVNDTYWTPGSAAPVFLCVGGEGPPLDGSVVSNSVHCNNAVEWLKETGALMFAVEHRYYGCHNRSACPVADPTAKGGLKYLSSRQALGDLARFHSFAVREYNLTAKNKWVTWGGSYPGMLAGWFRLKFPHLIHASVASSAPVEAQLDMRGYNDVLAEAYTVSNNGVGGSLQCMKNIADGHRVIGEMFNSTSGRERLASLFGRSADWYSSWDNQAMFAGNGVAMFPAQSNDPSCQQPACNIGKICEIMTDSSLGDNVAKLAQVVKKQTAWTEPKWMKKERALEEADYWGYQTCTEFAFYQTCEVGSMCFFTQGYVTLDSMTSFCREEFSIPLSLIARNVEFTNSYYGGSAPAGSCIIFPNGQVDPWRALSVLKKPSPTVDILSVDGASHHAWTHPSKSTDQPSVVAARAALRKAVEGYLAQDCEQPQL